MGSIQQTMGHLLLAALTVAGICGCTELKTVIVADAGSGGAPGDAGPDTGEARRAGSEDGGLTTGGDTGGAGSSDGGGIMPTNPGPGEFMAPCGKNEDCKDGLCVDTDDGPVCSRACLEGCPDGFACRSVANTYPDLFFVCVPESSSRCKQCSHDVQCGGGVCAVAPDAGVLELTGAEPHRVCLLPCGDPPECPDGYACTGVGEDSAPLCVPVSGSCECLTGDEVLQRLCAKRNEHGTCFGAEQCAPETGFADCDAPFASAEVCNGLDDNCDGLLDEGLPTSEACTREVENVGVCEGIRVCTGTLGWRCDAPIPTEETCNDADDDCDGDVDEPFRDDEGRYVSHQHCGQCFNDCSGRGEHASSGVCELRDGTPRCVLDCDAGHADVDGNPLTGCECVIESGDDHPDGQDRNCDGVDGDIASAIFVGRSGDDEAAGTRGAPVRTIGKGLALAAERGLRDVYVTTGLYAETVTLGAGLSLYGGYSADFGERDPAQYETAILGADHVDGLLVSVVGVDIAGEGAPTNVDGFVVFGQPATTRGESTYAVYLRGCDARVEIRDCHVTGGAGGDGVPGASGEDGAGAAAGDRGRDVATITSESCDQTNAGGAGGTNSCGGEALHGGDGGTAVCPDFDEETGPDFCAAAERQTIQAVERGSRGLPSGGAGGEPGGDSYTNYYQSSRDCNDIQAGNCTSCFRPEEGRVGRNGGDGAAGRDGATGAACSGETGSVVDARWVPARADDGGSGSRGHGGGGGGAGGGGEVIECGSNLGEIGASGGGGGAGGCAGTLGRGGAAGGGSFAVFVALDGALTAPRMTGNRIALGRGGFGGDGGAAGVGGSGGLGGAGGLADLVTGVAGCGGQGGHGGAGGRGGHGGGGGGGCGGPSHGILVHPPDALASDPYADTNDFVTDVEPARGGEGGPSLGARGEDGAAGVVRASNL